VEGLTNTHKLQSCVRFSSTTLFLEVTIRFGGDQTLPVFWHLLLGPFMTISIPLTFFKLLSPSSTHLILPPNPRTYHIFNPFLLVVVRWPFNFYVHPRSTNLFFIRLIVSCFVSITHACGPTAHVSFLFINSLPYFILLVLCCIT